MIPEGDQVKCHGRSADPIYVIARSCRERWKGGALFLGLEYSNAEKHKNVSFSPKKKIDTQVKYVDYTKILATSCAIKMGGMD